MCLMISFVCSLSGSTVRQDHSIGEEMHALSYETHLLYKTVILIYRIQFHVNCQLCLTEVVPYSRLEWGLDAA